MPRVLNTGTGLEHDVPPGHYSLSSPLFEVLPNTPPPVEPEGVDEWGDLTVHELREYADQHDVDLSGVTRKAEIIDAIRAK